MIERRSQLEKLGKHELIDLVLASESKTEEPRPTDSKSPPSKLLTPRQIEVLRLLAKGMMNKEIAGELGIVKRTVDTHTDSIYTKLGIHNRTEATLWATENGYGAEKQVEPPTLSL